jgi:hypothetical protein
MELRGRRCESNIAMIKKLLLFVSFAFIFVSCGNEKKQEQQQTEIKLPALPDFNADSAYAFVKAQCDFGPRVPNTAAHVACGDYLIGKMKQWSDTVYVQSGILNAYDNSRLKFRNIIATFNQTATRRILLFAHWDTRPWADQDTVDSNKPPLGADDGASGVGILMEIARQLHAMKPQIGIDIAFFDAEDWGKKGGGDEAEDSYALGTQFWAKKPHVANYMADYGILLDMTGARNAHFRKEGLSKTQAGFVVDKVWGTANKLGFSSYFLYEDGGWVTDDHVYVNKINIPAIDIINSDPGTRSGFASHWHRHADNMDVIDRNTLRSVGQTLLGVIFWENI